MLRRRIYYFTCGRSLNYINGIAEGNITVATRFKFGRNGGQQSFSNSKMVLNVASIWPTH